MNPLFTTDEWLDGIESGDIVDIADEWEESYE